MTISSNHNHVGTRYWAVLCPRRRSFIPLWPVLEKPGELPDLTGPVVFSCPRCGRLHSFQSRELRQIPKWRACRNSIWPA